MNELEHSIEVHQLEKRFGDFKAVAGITFQVRRGEIFGFLGPNGAGKSTTIRMLCGLLTPTAGTGRVAGFDVVREPEKIKTRIGYMSQRFSLYDELTVEENIEFYSGIYRVPKLKKAQRREWVIEMAGLQDQRRTRTSQLSGGWKQRLALGCAVLHEPPILFLDEPTSGVDPNSRRRFWDLIYGLARQGVTVLVTTHYMEEAEYCDRLVVIYRGELVALGTPRELKTQHMRGTVIDVRCSDPQKALQVLQSRSEVKEVALFGRGLHVVASDDTFVSSWTSALSAERVAVHSIGAVVPTLEDVFVSLIEQRDQQGRVG
jgi:ABC-2 type transport system ATP-binding protein